MIHVFYLLISLLLIGSSYAPPHRFKNYNRRVIQLMRVSGFGLLVLAILRFFLSLILK